VLVAAGAVDHEELVAQAEAAFGAVPDEDASTSVQSLLAKVCPSAAAAAAAAVLACAM
jgi:predicted Zn-dependent peptidase